MIFPSVQNLSLDQLASLNLEQTAVFRFFPLDYGPLPWFNIQSVTILSLDQLSSLEYSDAFVLDMDPDESDEEPVEPEEPVVGFDPEATYDFTQPLPTRLTLLFNWRAVEGAYAYQIRINGVIQARVQGRHYRLVPTDSPVVLTVEAVDYSGKLIASFEYVAVARAAFERVQVLWVHV